MGFKVVRGFLRSEVQEFVKDRENDIEWMCWWDVLVGLITE